MSPDTRTSEVAATCLSVAVDAEQDIVLGLGLHVREEVLHARQLQLIVVAS
jgi:hypothetical protein